MEDHSDKMRRAMERRMAEAAPGIPEGLGKICVYGFLPTILVGIVWMGRGKGGSSI